MAGYLQTVFGKDKNIKERPVLNVARNIIVGIISTIVFIVACGYFYIVVTFNGGINGYIRNLKPEPNPSSSAINAKREATTAEINQSFDELQNLLHYNYYETAMHDYCSKGQNNWKVSDGYAYRCSIRITKFYGFNSNFRQQMIDFEQKIISIGWLGYHRPDSPCEKMLKEYYDPYPEKLVSDLPSFDCRYKKDGLSLEPEFAEKETHEFSEFDYAQKVSGDSLFEIYDERDFQDSSLVIKKITDTDGFVLVISIQKTYFQN